jgi:hypothetical protein
MDYNHMMLGHMFLVFPHPFPSGKTQLGTANSFPHPSPSAAAWETHVSQWWMVPPIRKYTHNLPYIDWASWEVFCFLSGAWKMLKHCLVVVEAPQMTCWDPNLAWGFNSRSVTAPIMFGFMNHLLWRPHQNGGDWLLQRPEDPSDVMQIWVDFEQGKPLGNADNRCSWQALETRLMSIFFADQGIAKELRPTFVVKHCQVVLHTWKCLKGKDAQSVSTGSFIGHWLWVGL